MNTLRYVILHHDGIETPHFDLMFETSPGSPLATWRSSQWPIRDSIAVEKLADHRRDYLTYEGPVSGDRGYVRRVEEGTARFTTGASDCIVEGNGWTLRFSRGEAGDWRCDCAI